MRLHTENYEDQNTRWPQKGRHILAQFDSESVVVYQAYRPEIGHFAVKNQYFGGAFSFSRMSWIKPNFLWMMYRSAWASKPGQEVVLAVRLKREAFDQILADAVHSSFISQVYKTRDNWQKQVKTSSVRLQWDPDHTPVGNKAERRAIQLGLRGAVIKSYSRDWIIDIEDISEEVRRLYLVAREEKYDQLMLPREDVYPVTDPAVRARLLISDWESP